MFAMEKSVASSGRYPIVCLQERPVVETGQNVQKFLKAGAWLLVYVSEQIRRQNHACWSRSIAKFTGCDSDCNCLRNKTRSPLETFARQVLN